MRALCLHQLGGAFSVDDLPDPVPAHGQIVVDIAFAAVNPLDIWVSRGDIGVAAAHLPWVPGTEATGYIAGRPVFVRGNGLGVTLPGLASERAVVPPATVMDLPEGLDLALAAALGTAGTTAWNSVHTKAHVVAGDRVVVLGASGGVGTVAVQLARATGATVWAQTGSAAKAISITGADHVFVAADGAQLRAALVAIRPTVVLDALGGDYTGAAIDGLEPGGRLVIYGTSAHEEGRFNVRRIYRKGLSIFGYTNIVEPVERQQAVLATLFAALCDGTLRVPHEIIPLAEAHNAHQRLLDRAVEGKLVIDCRR